MVNIGTCFISTKDNKIFIRLLIRKENRNLLVFVMINYQLWANGTTLV